MGIRSAKLTPASATSLQRQIDDGLPDVEADWVMSGKISWLARTHWMTPSHELVQGLAGSLGVPSDMDNTCACEQLTA